MKTPPNNTNTIAALAVVGALLIVSISLVVVRSHPRNHADDSSTTFTEATLPPQIEPIGPHANVDHGPNLEFTSAEVGWYVGGGANPGGGGNTLFQTQDGGASWNVVASGSDVGASIDFANSNDGWISDDSQGLLRTTDGGASWTLIPPTATGSTDQIVNSDAEIVRTEFLDSEDGYALTYGSDILKSSDGGETWSNLSAPVPSGSVADICFSSAEVGFISTTQGVYITIDGGSTWTETTSAGQQSSIAEPLACSQNSAVLDYTPGIEQSSNITQTSDAVDGNGQPAQGTWTTPIEAPSNPANQSQIPNQDSSSGFLTNGQIDRDLVEMQPGSFAFTMTGYPNGPQPPGAQTTQIVAYSTSDSGSHFSSSPILQIQGASVGVAGLAAVPGDPTALKLVVWYSNAPQEILGSTDAGQTWTVLGHYDFDAEAGGAASSSNTGSTSTTTTVPATSTTVGTTPTTTGQTATP